MRAFATVVARELRAAAPIGWAALLTAALPWIAPLLPGVAAGAPRDLRVTTALVLSALLGGALALFSGAALLARDVADGRIGFFLALPLRAGTIWGARVLAAALIVYGSITIVLLPALLAWPTLPIHDSPVALAALLASPLVLLLVSHHLALALRSRSPWLVVDLAGLALAGAIIVQALMRLSIAAAISEAVVAAGVVAAIAVLALLASGGLALARGGVLLRRVHRAEMVCVLLALLVASASAAAYAAWVLHPDAHAVVAVDAVLPAPAGTWVVAAVDLRHRPSYYPWMLFDTASGRSMTLSSALVRGGGLAEPAFARDGSAVAWLRPLERAYGGPATVEWTDLRGREPRTRDTGIVVRDAWEVTLVPDGDRLALLQRDHLSVWSEHGRRQLAVAALPGAHVGDRVLQFLPGDRLRLARLAWGADGVTMLQRFELSLASRRLVRVPDVAIGDQVSALALSADGERLLIARGLQGRGGIDLVEFAAREVRPLVAADTTATTETGRPLLAEALFLPDGRIAAALVRDGRATLRLLDPDGRPQRELPLGAAHNVWLSAPWRSGALAYTATVPAPAGSDRKYIGELREVDLGSGRVRVVGTRVIPLAFFWWRGGADRMASGAPATQLFEDHHRFLVRITPSGERHQLLPPPG